MISNQTFSIHFLSGNVGVAYNNPSCLLRHQIALFLMLNMNQNGY